MKSIIINLLLTVYFLSFFSCEDGFKKEVEPPQSSVESKCVVQSYLNAENDDIEVHLSWSLPTFNQDFTPRSFENTEVILSDESGKSVHLLPKNVSSGYFRAKAKEFPLTENQTYFLEVIIPNYSKITANCRIPKKLNTDIQNLRIVNTFDSGGEAFYIAFEFDDLPDEKNYYLVNINMKNSEIFEGHGNYRTQLEIKPFTDTNRDGDKIFIRTENLLGKVNNPQSITVDVFSVDKSFYDYKRTLLQQKLAEEAGPFGEPVFIISNVKNGLGVLGAYTQVSKTETVEAK